MSSEPILVSVGLAYVTEHDPTVSAGKLLVLGNALARFIENKSSLFEAAQIFQTTIGTTKPFDRITAILKTSEHPIPDFSMYSGNGNLARKKTRSWTAYEDQRLLAAIHRFGTDNWLQVAAFVGNGRTRAQCSQRWVRGLDPRISKDRWTKEDEELLERLVEQYGKKSWTRVASEMGNRSDVQCRYHYNQMKQSASLGQAMKPPGAISASGSMPMHLSILRPPEGPQASQKVVLPSIADLLAPPRPGKNVGSLSMSSLPPFVPKE